MVNIANARPGVYTDVIADIAEKRICPFCPEHIRAIHKNPIEERVHWLVTDNMYPYKPTKRHILLIHRAHIETVGEMSVEAWGELRQIIDDVTRAKNVAGGALVLRFGDTKFTGASVTHLHAHLVQSSPEDPIYDKKVGLQTRIG